MSDKSDPIQENKYSHYTDGLVKKVDKVKPLVLYCKKCGNDDLTVSEAEHSRYAYLACFGLCLCGCAAGCCLIPFCMEDCKDAHHSCSRCGNDLAFKKAFDKK